MNVDDLRDIARYNREVLERYERKLRRLGWPAIVKDRGTGHLSLKDTYLHIVQVADGWLNYIVPGRVAEMRTRPDPYALNNWREIRRWTQGVWNDIDRSLADLTEAELDRRVRAPWMRGRYTVRDAHLQVTFEQAHHLGEMIGVFWQMDDAPPEMTWIDTHRMRGPPRRRSKSRRRAR